MTHPDPEAAEIVRLLPCPFCGAQASLEQDSDHHGDWFNLGCSRHWGAVDDGCCGGRLWYTADPSELEGAIAAWNRRVTQPPEPSS